MPLPLLSGLWGDCACIAWPLAQETLQRIFRQQDGKLHGAHLYSPGLSLRSSHRHRATLPRHAGTVAVDGVAVKLVGPGRPGMSRVGFRARAR